MQITAWNAAGSWYLIALAVVVIVLFTGFRVAQQFERGVVFRFGRHTAFVVRASSG